MKTISGDKIFFNFIEVNFNDSKDFAKKNYFQEIKDGSLKGVVFRNVFSESEVNQILKGIKNIPNDDFLDVIYGKIFPAPFAIVNSQDGGDNQYFNSLEKFEKSKSSTSMELVVDRLRDFFNQTNVPHGFDIPEDTLTNQKFAKGTLRFFQPNKGGLHIHCGFYHQEAEFYKRLNEDVLQKPQLSYFLVLQNADSGGELTIYDLLWEEGMKKDYVENNNFIIGKDDKKIYFSLLYQFKIKPMPGDILVFSGGDIWHRVENIQGTRERITFGGFINYSKNTDKIYPWS